MTRAVLVCPEPLGHQQPAGIGIRFLEMARVLLADGHQVTVLSRDGGSVPGCKSGTITPEALHACTSAADVAIVQGHAANDLFAHGAPIPVVVDLYDPFIIENLHYFAARGSEVFSHDHATLIRSLVRGDLFLCASDAQRLFYLGALLAVGRLQPVGFADDPRFDDLIRIAPFGVPRRRVPAAESKPHSVDVLFGGIYDWYDPLLAIDAVALAREALPDLTLTFTMHPNPSLTPQGKLAEAMNHARVKGYEFVRFEPWIAYDERNAFYSRFGSALLTFPQSIETDLSMRTRIYDYVWGGLPVVTSSAPGTDELLTQYGAGVVVRSAAPADFATSLVRTLGDDRSGMIEGGQRFVTDHQWSRTLQPLVDFVRAPRVDPQKETFAVPIEVAEQPRSLLDRIKRRIGAPS